MLRTVRAHPAFQMLVGLATYVPGVVRIGATTGGTSSARYCYSVWLRHLVTAYRRSFISSVPRRVAEIGPGDSLGIGLAALLSGVERYYAFDVVEYADQESNLHILDALIDLFQRRASIPDDSEFPLVTPRLESYDFPTDILDEQHLAEALSARRLTQIRHDLMNRSEAGRITYVVPWTDIEVANAVCREVAVDMIYSQAVLEHVDDLSSTYDALYTWLNDGGIMSHSIDFTSHQTHRDWFGHWTYSERTWKIIRGKRSYLLNRQALSQHLETMREAGFDIPFVAAERPHVPAPRGRLSLPFRGLSDDDLATASAFVIAVRRQMDDARAG